MIFLNLLLWTAIYKTVRYLAHDYNYGILKDWTSNEDSRTLAFYSVSTIHSLIMSILPLYYYYTSPEKGLIRNFNENELDINRIFIEGVVRTVISNNYVFKDEDASPQEIANFLENMTEQLNQFISPTAR